MYKKEFDLLRDQVERMMGDLFKDMKPLGYRPQKIFHPPMDIYETAEHLVVVLEIAGMKPENIQVLFDKEILSISGNRIERGSIAKIRLHQMEIDYGDFERSLRIPFPLQVDEFKATYQQGFLMVTVPKLKKPISRNVEVKVR
jgi:HSP20 family protein